jgi:hypothetical protein
MISNIEQPVALATVTWVTPEEGGRRSGPPTAQVYSATAVFRSGNDEEVMQGWPATGDQISVLLQRVSQPPSIEEIVKVGFLYPELAQSSLLDGVEFLVLEGPKVVAYAVVIALLPAPLRKANEHL